MGMDASRYRGCLLGLAVGDAMGCAVDGRTYAEICDTYGPNGLMGYDEANDRCHITSNTQIAAFVCNALLAGATREQARGRAAVRHAAGALREWAVSQRTYSPPEKTLCWVTRLPQLRGHDCLDIRALWVLTREKPGPPSSELARFDTLSALLAAIPFGLYMTPGELLQTAQVLLPLSHSDYPSFFAATTLSMIIAHCVQTPEASLSQIVERAMDAVCASFDSPHPRQLLPQLRMAQGLARNGAISPPEAMDRLKCETCPQILAGALYACLGGEEDFDETLIAAVNHSGRSAAVAAVAGAIVGLRRGEEVIHDFYRESLAPAWVLQTLGEDMARGCPRVFDDAWNEKYRRGRPVEPGGWATV